MISKKFIEDTLRKGKCTVNEEFVNVSMCKETLVVVEIVWLVILKEDLSIHQKLTLME